MKEFVYCFIEIIIDLFFDNAVYFFVYTLTSIAELADFYPFIWRTPRFFFVRLSLEISMHKNKFWTRWEYNKRRGKIKIFAYP